MSNKGRKRGSAVRKKPLTIDAHTYSATLSILWIVALLFAAFGAIGWLFTFWAISKFLAFGLASVFLGVPLAAAAVTGPLVHAAHHKQHATAALLFVATLGLALVDGAGNTRAFWQFEKNYGAEKVASELEAHEAYISQTTQDATGRLANAEHALAHIPQMPERACWCPETRTSDLMVYNALADPLIRDRERALDDLKELREYGRAWVPPAAPRLLPKAVSASVAVLVALAIVIAFIGTHAMAIRSREAALAASQAKRRRKRPSSARTRKPQEVKPTMHALNDNIKTTSSV